MSLLFTVGLLGFGGKFSQYDANKYILKLRLGLVGIAFVFGNGYAVRSLIK